MKLDSYDWMESCDVNFFPSILTKILLIILKNLLEKMTLCRIKLFTLRNNYRITYRVFPTWWYALLPERGSKPKTQDPLLYHRTGKYLHGLRNIFLINYIINYTLGKLYWQHIFYLIRWKSKFKQLLGNFEYWRRNIKFINIKLKN